MGYSLVNFQTTVVSSPKNLSVVVTTPTSIVVGDLLVAFVRRAQVPQMNVPSGWTTITTLNPGSGFTPAESTQGLYYRVVDGTETSTYTWTDTAGNNTDTWVAGIAAFRGVDKNTNYTGHSGSNAGSNNGPASFLTNSYKGGELTVAVVTMGGSTPGITDPPASFTSIFNITESVNGMAACMDYQFDGAPGTSAPGNVSINASGANWRSYAATFFKAVNRQGVVG